MSIALTLIAVALATFASHAGGALFLEYRPSEWRRLIWRYVAGVVAFLSPWTIWALATSPEHASIVLVAWASVAVAGLVTVLAYLLGDSLQSSRRARAAEEVLDGDQR